MTSEEFQAWADRTGWKHSYYELMDLRKALVTTNSSVGHPLDRVEEACTRLRANPERRTKPTVGQIISMVWCVKRDAEECGPNDQSYRVDPPVAGEAAAGRAWLSAVSDAMAGRCSWRVPMQRLDAYLGVLKAAGVYCDAMTPMWLDTMAGYQARMEEEYDRQHPVESSGDMADVVNAVADKAR